MAADIAAILRNRADKGRAAHGDAWCQGMRAAANIAEAERAKAPPIPSGFVLTGLSPEQLVEKLVEFGFAEDVRDRLLLKIGTPLGTVIVSDPGVPDA